MAALSPLAPERFPELPPIAGVRLAPYAAGIPHARRNGTMLAGFAPGLTGAGPLGCEPREVFISSTGVIGEPPPADRISAALPKIIPLLDAGAWEPAARAIMTTDTFPKGATATATIAGMRVRINGFCKGSGVIAPDMATMLAYVFTDAALPASVLQSLLAEANERSFNCVTVDGDTSTSDTVLLCATHQVRHAAITSPGDSRLGDFRRALAGLTTDLSMQLARDGEGAEKFITIEVTGAESDRAARRIGLSIGNSPLVKTALAAGDANWGRIVMAVGQAREPAPPAPPSIPAAAPHPPPPTAPLP